MTSPKKEVLRPVDDDAIRLARTLLRASRHGALATLSPVDGAPLASRVAMASDCDGAPLILVSALSAHTAALRADARCSLLVGEPGKGDPLAHSRMTISARAVELDRKSPQGKDARRRYLAALPKAALYADFADFSFFRLEPAGASLNGGFARAYDLAREHLLLDAELAREIGAVEESAVIHMNADHAEAIAAYARHFGAQSQEREWRLSGIDADGLDLRSGDEVLRIFFDAPLATPAELREKLVSMARQARSA
jgi:heme iron utilization protein